MRSKDKQDRKRRTGIQFLRDVFFRSPTTGKRMRIIDAAGAETLLDHLRVVCGNKDERLEFRISVSELPADGMPRKAKFLAMTDECGGKPPRVVGRGDTPGEAREDAYAAGCGANDFFVVPANAEAASGKKPRRRNRPPAQPPKNPDPLALIDQASHSPKRRPAPGRKPRIPFPPRIPTDPHAPMPEYSEKDQEFLDRVRWL